MQRGQLIKSYNAGPKNRLRIFVFPFAGGGASIFRNWECFLSEEIEICPIQLPGREERYHERPYAHINDLTADICELMTGYGDLPFVFFGHSMGAFLCYEACRALSASGKPLPLHVYLSGASPAIKREALGFNDSIGDEALLAGLRKFNGIPEDILNDKTLLGLFLNIIRSDFSILKTIDPGNGYKFSMPVTVFGGDADGSVPADELYEWNNYTNAYCAQFILPGDHFFIFSQKETILSHLNNELRYLANSRL